MAASVADRLDLLVPVEMLWSLSGAGSGQGLQERGPGSRRAGEQARVSARVAWGDHGGIMEGP